MLCFIFPGIQAQSECQMNSWSRKAAQERCILSKVIQEVRRAGQHTADIIPE